MRFRFWLPLIQVILAATLLVSNYLRPNTFENPSWNKPDKQWCFVLNAPASLIVNLLTLGLDAILLSGPHALLEYTLQRLLETVVFLPLVALMWCVVGMEIDGRGRDRLSVVTPRAGSRILADGLLIMYGAALIVLAILYRRPFGAIHTYSDLIYLPYLVWGWIILLFYGHDLLVYLTRKLNKGRSVA